MLTFARLRGKLYIRGRAEARRIRKQAFALSEIIGSSELEWFTRDCTGVLMRRTSDDNFGFMLRNGVQSDLYTLGDHLVASGGEVAIDVGANRGQSSVMLARKFKRVIAFEPDPTNVDRMRETLSLNGANTVEVVECALSADPGFKPLRLSESHGHHTLEREHVTAKVSELLVAVDTLDEVVEKLKISEIDLLKIDVEGHELSVLMGSQSILRAQRARRIYFEHSPVLLELQGHAVEAVINFLKSFNYEVMTIDGESVDDTKAHQLLQCDLVAVPTVAKEPGYLSANKNLSW